MGMVQFILLLLGNIGFWGCLAGYGPSLAMHFLFKVDPGLLFFLGTGLGIILGIVFTFQRAAADGMPAWQLSTWIGIVLGVALFWVIRPITFAVFLPWWWVWAMPIGAAGMLGGLAGTYLWPILQQRRAQGRRKKRVTKAIK